MSNRIFILSTSFSPGSAETNHNLSFLRAFSEFGMELTIGYFYPDRNCSRLEANCDLPGVTPTYFWKKSVAGNKLLRHLWMHLSYARFFFGLKREDVVMLTGSAQFLPLLVARSKRAGFFVFHEKTEHPDVHAPIVVKYFKERYLPSCAQADGLFVISNTLRDYFVSKGCNPDKVKVINMVVDPARFKNITKHADAQDYIAYCGNVSNSKDGVDILIKSFAKVVEAIGDDMPELRLKLIGNPPKGDDVDNAALVKELGLQDRVEFTGFVKAEDMPQILTDARILALSRPDNLQARNGFPTKLGEYLLSGNPVVVTRAGEIPLFFQDGENALLCPCGDVDAFAGKLLWALRNPAEAAEIGARGKQVAIENFNYLTESRKIADILLAYAGMNK